jgi:hypothetical protein
MVGLEFNSLEVAKWGGTGCAGVAVSPTKRRAHPYLRWSGERRKGSVGCEAQRRLAPLANGLGAPPPLGVASTPPLALGLGGASVWLGILGRIPHIVRILGLATTFFVSNSKDSKGMMLIQIVILKIHTHTIN